MKSLMFTLLDVMARDAGCRDEAWELVLEFADAEQATSSEDAPGGEPSETIKACAFEVPAEAMLRCLSEAASGELGDPSALDFPQISSQGVCFNDLPVPDPIQELLVGGAYDAMPKAGGFQAGAFSGDSGDRWDAEEESDLDAADDLFNSVYPPFDPPIR